MITLEQTFLDACEGGKFNTVEKCIRRDVNINVQDEDGKTALMSVSACGHTKIAKLLIDSGADVNIQDNGGYFALMYACFHGKFEISEYLLKNGADVHLQNKYGNTALIAACDPVAFLKAGGQNYFNVIEMLIEANIDVNVRGIRNKMAIDLAKDTLENHAGTSATKCKEVIRLLTDAMNEQKMNKQISVIDDANYSI